ncbi:hypothetical protein NBRC110019_13280 [Neptunitalea chrysea]|uniref:Por secretion system C-terminal sorting domain-containing protein n=1 Tax=Neptunitalea chrysea TaxID=1647581 RepID=A0A9W6B6R8_9FLAO|nr:endonuclease [Neptunitalea chrysea]GLB52289.1 hypothetical protein NBRC110019_13280 [Neptunitalea chrysea]
MNKKLLLVPALLLTASIVFAQIPTGYYDSANGLTGYALKTQLKKIIDAVDDTDIASEYLHNDQGYNAMDTFISSYDVDIYYENDNTILDPYSENPSGADPYNFTAITDECGNYSAEGDCYNKEHVIPQSVFSQNDPMRGDAHHLLPTDGRVNGFRSNYPFGIVDDNNLVSQSGISNPTMNGSKLGANLNSGTSAGYSGTVFEPIDEFKGDIARIYFYFVTRYEDQISNWSSYAMFNDTTNQVIDEPFLSILLEWNTLDPVSQKEIDRNNNIFTYQNNRNPFIDHPEYITEIWGGSSTTDTQAPTTPLNVTTNLVSSFIAQVDWDASTDNVAVTEYDVYMNNTYYTSTSTTSITTGTLSPETTYCFYVIAKDAASNNSAESTQSCEMTPASSGDYATDLFFSEYVEGSGNNKALEIANFTGATINLSTYSLKLSANGNSGWTQTYSFPTSATVSDSDVYVIGNGSLTVCTSEVDDQNNAITGFNGNDAIGLFKDGVLIDIIGELGNSSDFAQNTTLVRIASVHGSNTTFNLSEWDNYSSNTCYLGFHTIAFLDTNEFNSKDTDISIHPNPVTNGVVSFEIPQNVSIEGIELYSMLGNKVLSIKSLTNNQLKVSQLAKGIYLLNIQTNSQTVTKKLVIK